MNQLLTLFLSKLRHRHRSDVEDEKIWMIGSKIYTELQSTNSWSDIPNDLLKVVERCDEMLFYMHEYGTSSQTYLKLKGEIETILHYVIQ